MGQNICVGDVPIAQLQLFEVGCICHSPQLECHAVQPFTLLWIFDASDTDFFL